MCSNKPEQCSIGKISETECHKLSYTKQINLVSVTSLEKSDVSLISLRSGVSLDKIINVCEHHKCLLLSKFETFQKFCVDPFQLHKKKISKSLRVLSLDYSNKINSLQNHVKTVPGQKICDNCRQKVDKNLQEESEIGLRDELCSDDEDIISLEKSLDKEKSLDELNLSIQNLGESPFKLHAIAPHCQSSYAKRKLTSVTNKLKCKVGKVLEKEFSLDESPCGGVSKIDQQKIKDMDRLVELIKEKLNVTTSQKERLQILTLVPASWSRKRISEEFSVSEYTARKSKELFNEKGILAIPEPRKGRPLSQNVIDCVKNFYQNGEFSRVMPGAKDKISISKNQYMQKILLLGNLNEMYAAFKFEHPDIKIGLSKFCMLRPKWCVLAGSAGTHFVCVCTIHENVSLLLHACSIEESYKELIEKLVCSVENKDCMLRHCPNCPSSANLRQFIKDKFEDWDPDEEVTYSSWVSTDRTQQVQSTVTLEEYLDVLIERLEKLIPHSFITKAQARYLKELKSNMNADEAVVLVDFSENYSFVIQNEAQGYHWTNSSCSLHAVVIYTRNTDTGDLLVTNMCIVSDDLEHDVAFVHKTQKYVSEFLKNSCPEVTRVTYYSDGCAAQYKNCKNFLNLCLHEKDFGIKATWCFFATSHGKSPCDGIGGTVKRIVSKASLQCSPGSAINNADKFFDFCRKRIENIIFVMIRKEELMEARQELEGRFTKAKTVPGTRSFHHFEPNSEDSVATKRISFDANFCSIFSFSADSNLVKMSDVGLHNYIACIYDDLWYFALVLSKDESEGDIQVKFMHPHGPASSFHWPTKEDMCWIPLSNVICCVNTPVTKASGRVYYFTERDNSAIDLQCKKMLEQTHAH